MINQQNPRPPYAVSKSIGGTHNLNPKKSEAIDLKLPKGIDEALPKGNPEYGVKLEALRALVLKPSMNLKKSLMVEEKLAEPNRTHRFNGFGSAAINTVSEQPSSDFDRDRKPEDKVELIGIKKPGEHILDAILNAASSSSPANKEYKVYAPRRIFPDKTKLTGALDQNFQETVEKKVQRALSTINAKSNNQVDGASSFVDAAKIKQQVADSLAGVDGDKTLNGSTDKASVNEDEIEQKAAIDKPGVDKDEIEQKAALDKACEDRDGAEQEAALDKACIDKGEIEQKAAVEKPTVDKESIEEQANVSVGIDLTDKFSEANSEIEDRVSEGVKQAISGKTDGTTAAKVGDEKLSVENSDSLDQTLEKQASDFRDSGDAKRKKAREVSVPPVTQDCVKTEKVWYTLGFTTRCTEYAPNPKSEADHETALAERESLNDQADADYNAANKIDAKREELDRSQSGYSATDALPNYSFAQDSSATISDSTQSDRSQQDVSQIGKNHHDPYSLNHESSRHRVLELSKITNYVIAEEDINASIGFNSAAIQNIASVKGSVSGFPTFSVLPLTTRSELINASIGDQTLARQMIDQLGSSNRETVVPNGIVSFGGVSIGGVNAAIGYKSEAYHIQSLVAGRFSSAEIWSLSGGFVNASIGSNTISSLRLAVFEGNAKTGSLDLSANAAGVIVAAIGSDSSARFDLASSQNVTTTGDVKMHVVAPGAIAASIGSDSSASTLLGSAIDASANKIDVKVTQVLPAIAAAIGVNSEAHNAVAVLQPQVRVGGLWEADITYGQLTAFSLGADTTAINEIGVISANVSGDIKQNINVGAMLAGTLGLNTEATNKIGNVEAPVRGSVETNIDILDVNTMSLGLSTGGSSKSIYSRTLIGNVFGESGSVRQDISIYGPIVNLGIGLVIELPIFGTLDLSHKGCVSIGNVGPSQC